MRGFATKFYTREGNWDLVGNNIPVFFIQDAIKFPDLIHAAKQEPDRGFPQAQTAHDNFWDFASLMPEATHMLMWIMSDRAIPRSFRFMEGFGVHTFRLVNEAGRSTYVKFHWKPARGLQSVVWNEAVKINGADPDFHRRDLWDAIQSGDYPEWELGLQLFDDDFAEVERAHIAEAFTFELSKCEREEIRTRMVAGLRNVDEALAAKVAEGLGLRELPAPTAPAREPRHDLPASPALSILGRDDGGRNGQGDFAGRKLGVLVTNGADAETLAGLRAAAAEEGVTVEIVAPAVGGVDVSDGTRVRADQQVDGAPSVLYDAVAILASPGGARSLAARPTARDFVTDAVAHCKFIGYTSGAAVLFEAAGLPMDPAGEDEGFISLSEYPAAVFIARCRELRFWDRQLAAAG